MLTINASIAILVGLADHLVNLVISQLLANRGHDMTELGGGDEAVVVAVEDLEGLSDLLFGVSVLHLASHHGEEFWRQLGVHGLRSVVDEASTRKVNGAVVVSVHLVDHVLELRLAGVLAERAHDGAQLLGGDLTCATVLIWVHVVRRSI